MTVLLIYCQYSRFNILETLLAGGAVRRGGQAEPEHLLGRVHPQQVPRGGRAPLLHHQDGRSATGSDTLGKDTVAPAYQVLGWFCPKKFDHLSRLGHTKS